MASNAASESRFFDIDVLTLNIVGHLGRGAYGTVHKAKWRGEPVAVKIMDNESDEERKSFINEMKILRDLAHPNIVKVYGACVRPRIALVMELMDNGSVHDLLHAHVNLIYKTDHVFSWARQCSDAVSFMHSRQFVHRDLKPPNLLLKNEYRLLKVCDFGTVSKLRTVMSNNRGTAAWMAPEVFSTNKYDEKCDVYSFGIILWEMITRRRPFQDIEGTPLTILWKAYSGSRPPPIADCPDVLMDLIVRCWDKEPNARPTMQEVFDVLTVFTTIFNDGESPLIDTSASGTLDTETAEPRPVLLLTPPTVPSITLVAPNDEVTPTASCRRSSSPISMIRDISPHSSSEGVSRQRRSGRWSSESSNDALDGSFRFLDGVDPDLRPIMPWPNQIGQEQLYFQQLSACRGLYEVENELRSAIQEKHELLNQVHEFLELDKRRRKLEQIRSLREECEKRISTKRKSFPFP